MIPRNFHRVWVGSEEMPERFRVWLRGWSDLHPAWTQTLHGEDAADGLTEALAACYHAAKTPASKADILRLHLMWHYGGVYLDVDIEPIQPIDELLAGCEACVTFDPLFGQLSNAVLGFRRHHPAVHAMLEELPARFDPDNPLPTGPALVTDVLKHRGDVRILERHLFAPISWREDLDGPITDRRAYACHRFAKSWH